MRVLVHLLDSGVVDVDVLVALAAVLVRVTVLDVVVVVGPVLVRVGGVPMVVLVGVDIAHGTRLLTIEMHSCAPFTTVEQSMVRVNGPGANSSNSFLQFPCRKQCCSIVGAAGQITPRNIAAMRALIVPCATCSTLAGVRTALRGPSVGASAPVADRERSTQVQVCHAK
jgi:hypothetical protein